MRLSTVFLLLLLAAADLMVPGLCIAEATGPAAGSASSSLPLRSDVDDCFCCCAHIVPEQVQTWDRAVEEVTLVDESACQVPLVSATPLYHPPRA